MDAQPRTERQSGCLAAIGWLLQASLLLLLGASAIGLVGYHFLTNQFDEELRQHVVHALRQKFPQHYVDLQGARRLPGQGIELRSLSISAANESDDDRVHSTGEPAEDSLGLPGASPADSFRSSTISQLIYVEQIMLGCNTDFTELIAGRTTLHGAVVRGVRVRATRKKNREWDIARLIPAKRENLHCPRVTIGDGVIEILDELQPTLRPISVRNLELTIDPFEDSPHSDDSSSTDAMLNETPAEQNFELKGNFVSEFCDRVEFQGWLASNLSNWEILFQSHDIYLSPRLFPQLPVDTSQIAQHWGNSTALMNMSGRIWRDNRRSNDTQFDVHGKLSNGRIESRWLPFELSKATAEFRATNNGLQIVSASAKRDHTSFFLTGTTKGFTLAAPMDFQLRAKRLSLDSGVGRNLPSRAQLGWAKFQPAGLLDADVHFTFDGRSWQSDVRLDCLDVSFSYEKFPYRLENGQGLVEFLGDSMSTRGFVARANGRPVVLDAKFQRLGPDCTGWLEFLVDEPVPLDEKLFAALDVKTRRVVRSLRPSGFIRARGRLDREIAGQKFGRDFRIELQTCAINYERFSYPLYQVNGGIRITNNNWKFEGLSGHNDTAYIECGGQFVTTSDGDGKLALDFSVWDLPLEEELKNALPPTAQRVWSGLRPVGTIDHVAIAAQYDHATKSLALDVAAQKRPNQQNVDGRSLRIEPEWFPYSMHDLTGSVRYRNGIVELQKLKANHGTTQLQIAGECEFSADGSWHVRLAKLLADNIQVDRELLYALPPRLSESIGKLNIKSPVHLVGPGGRISQQPLPTDEAFELSGSPGAPVSSAWNFLFDMENGTIECGVKLDHIHGGVLMIGECSGQQFRSRGEIQVDSLTCRDVQLTELRGPFEVDNSKVAFGTMVTRSRPDETPRQITANAVHGAVAGNGQIRLTDDVSFLVDGSIFNGDLADAAREFTSRNSDVSGRVYGQVRLVGTMMGVHTLRGEGQLELAEADIYELPVMVRLLKLLRVREPDRSAFTSSDIKFRVEGDRIYFDNINFHGDLFSLRDGTGEMDFQRNVNLQFHTMVGREELRVPVLQYVLREASPRILTVHVKGTLDNPQVERELFREFNEGLKELFPEAAQRRTSDAAWRPQNFNLLKRR